MGGLTEAAIRGSYAVGEEKRRKGDDDNRRRDCGHDGERMRSERGLVVVGRERERWV